MNSLIGVILSSSIVFALVSFTLINISAAPSPLPTEFTWTTDSVTFTDIPVFDTTYYLQTNGNFPTEYNIQFKTGSVASGLSPGIYGLNLTSSTNSVDLQTYYNSEPIPDVYKNYLISAANIGGVDQQPFVFVEVNENGTVQLLDGARYTLGSQNDLGMAIPGDYPSGVYTVSGTVDTIEVTYTLAIDIPLPATTTSTAISSTTTSSTATTSTTIQPVCNIELTGTADFGQLSPNDASITDQTLTIANSGDATATNVKIYGTDWATGFSVTQTHWSTTSGMNYADMNLLHPQSLADSLSDLSPSSSLLTYSKLKVPAGQASGSYTQDITFSWSC